MNPLHPAYRNLPERIAAMERVVEAATTTLEENLHLADGDDCTLLALREAIAALDEMEGG